MNLKKIIDIYNIIKSRLPSTYPRPKLAFFQDEQHMLDNNDMEIENGESIYAIVDPDTYTINLPLKMTIEYTNSKGEVHSSIVPINKLSVDDLAHTIIHELSHLFYGEKFGYSSEKYNDEKACDKFANRWLKKMKREGLL